MAGLLLVRQVIIKRWIAASLLALLTGCTTLPSSPAPPQPPSPLTSSDTASAAPLPPPASPPKSRLSAFIAKRLLKKAETPVPLPAVEAEAAPAPEAVMDEKYRLTGEAARELERGNASWYGPRFHGRRTASGENYDKYALTAAHKTLPFGTVVRVRSLALGREVDVRINDRGPFSPGRVIDVSQAAAEALGLTGAGVAKVSLKVPGSAKSQADAPHLGKKSRKTRRKSLRRSPAAKRR